MSSTNYKIEDKACFVTIELRLMLQLCILFQKAGIFRRMNDLNVTEKPAAALTSSSCCRFSVMNTAEGKSLTL